MSYINHRRRLCSGISFTQVLHDCQLPGRKVTIIKLNLITDPNFLPKIIDHLHRNDLDSCTQVFLKVFPLLHKLYRHWAKFPSFIVEASHTLASLAKMLKIKQIKQLE